MATWHNHTFCLKISILGSPLDIQSPQDKNKFQFQEITNPSDNEIYQYSLKPVRAEDMKEAWGLFSKMLPQPGATLSWALTDDEKLDPKNDPAYPNKLKALVATIRKQKIDDPHVVYERLVGTVPALGADNPVTFYRVTGVFKGHEHKPLLIATANFINGGAPVGVLAADN
jgi:hypothetical protein